MKKICILLLVFLLIGCKKTDDISIIVPYGSPQLSQLYLQQSEDYAVDVVIGPEPLLAAFGSESHDVIFAPINLGAKLFTANENYTLLSVVTWGNYFFICPTNITEISQLQGQTVVVFGKNQV